MEGSVASDKGLNQGNKQTMPKYDLHFAWKHKYKTKLIVLLNLVGTESPKSTDEQ